MEKEITIAEEITPEEIEQEKRLAKQVTGALSINRVAMLEPDRVIQIMENRMKALEMVRLGAMRNTDPYDWVLSRDKEGHEIATLKKSGCVKVRKYFGISTINVRPSEVKITQNEDGGITAEIFGDGICALTGEMLVNVRGARNSGEDFVGGGPGREMAKTSDLKEAARTNLESKITRILGGMTAVPFDELKMAWAGSNKDPEKINKGRGYGKSKERESSNEGETTLEVLGALILSIAKQTGKTEADLLMEGTVYIKDGKKYWFKELSQLNEGWKIKKCHDRLIEKYGKPQSQAQTSQEVAP